MSSWVWQAIASAAVLAVAGGLAVVLAAGQSGSLTGLQERFHTRLDLTARFAAEYDADVLRREASVGMRALAGANPSQPDFEAVVADFGFEAALLLDKDGRVLQVYPAKPALIGTVLTAKYAHLRQAVAGSPAISNVVPSAARAVPVVAFAAPYDTPSGRRVLSGAYDVSTTPLAAHLRNALPFAGGEVYLLDAKGSVVSSNLPSTGTVQTIELIDPALPDAEHGQYLRDGQARWFTTTAVPGSSLRLVASVPESDLYGPINGTTVWLPWIVVLALTIASLYTVQILFALHRSREDYLALARIDPLTGISNRRELSAMAEALLADARRRDKPVGVLMLDLDRFKAINDTRGHEGGDEVLRVVSARMRNALRDGDLLGRWGGEEFVAFLPATTLAQAMMVGDRVRAAISGTPIAMVSDDPVTVTASIGCAVTVDDGAQEVIGRADQAMYLAKQFGDKVVASPEDEQAVLAGRGGGTTQRSDPAAQRRRIPQALPEIAN
ncbi:MAG: diguanylate cyclase [Candidatus Limnocylindrales bacterium]